MQRFGSNPMLSDPPVPRSASLDLRHGFTHCDVKCFPSHISFYILQNIVQPSKQSHCLSQRPHQTVSIVRSQGPTSAGSCGEDKTFPPPCVQHRGVLCLSCCRLGNASSIPTRKCNHISDIVDARQIADQPVEAETKSAMRYAAISS